MHRVVPSRCPACSPRSIVALLSLLLTVLLAPARSTTAAATVRADLWVANGRVFSVAVAGQTLYLGGEFTQVGPATGSFVGVDATTGSRDTAVPGVAAIDTAPGIRSLLSLVRRP